MEILKNYIIIDYEGNTIPVTASHIEEKEFKSIDELNTFVKMHPSSSYVIIKKCPDKIKVSFNVYMHDYWTGTGIVQSYSYNFNPEDDNNLKEYYKLKLQKSRLDYLITKFEN